MQMRYARATSLFARARQASRACVFSRMAQREKFALRAVVLASGGFEANREMRTRYLGPGWDMAKVRGTRYNTGDGIRMALDIGAQAYGQWSGCHSVAWERYAPDFGELDRPRRYRHSYPFSIMVNSQGKRFVDEGADFRNYTYAKYGRVVLQQPGSFAWQVFDAQVEHLLRDEYQGAKGPPKSRPNTLEDLVEKMQDVHPCNFLKTVREYNAAIKRDVPFDPNIKDGRRTSGLAIERPTGPTRSRSRRSRRIRSGAGSRSHSAGSRSTRPRACSTWRTRRCRACMPPASSSAAFLLQLSRQLGPHGGLGVRPHRRTRSRCISSRNSQNANGSLYLVRRDTAGAQTPAVPRTQKCCSISGGNSRSAMVRPSQ